MARLQIRAGSELTRRPCEVQTAAETLFRCPAAQTRSLDASSIHSPTQWHGRVGVRQDDKHQPHGEELRSIISIEGH